MQFEIYIFYYIFALNIRILINFIKINNYFINFVEYLYI